MLQAELNRKLFAPEMYRSEDLLTSSVFGTLMYLDSPEILIEFLRTARNLKGDPIRNITKIVMWRYHFWPRFQNQVEPDLLLQGFRNKRPIVNIIIEAKYHSTKNVYKVKPGIGKDQLTGDQLTDQFRSLLNRKWATSEVDSRRTSANYVIYLTNHFHLPKEELTSSVDKFSSNRYKNMLFWTSWRKLPEIIDKHFKNYGKGQQAMLIDLQNLLQRKRINRDPLIYIPPDFSTINEKQIHFFNGRSPKHNLRWDVNAPKFNEFFTCEEGIK